MSDCYLIDHPPRRSQFRRDTQGRPHRRATPSGVTVLHTAESMLDLIGVDTGAEGVARFICERTDPGSYHDLVDSDSCIQLVPYEAEAFQDGTGSNPHALSVSWAIRATDWPRLTPARTAALLEQGARAFARQQAWLRKHGYPTTPLRRITAAQADARVPGFVTHGDRDPGRRSDPGGRPDRFPWQAWFDACASACADLFDNDLEDDMPLSDDDVERIGRRVADFVAAGSPAENGTAHLRRLLVRVLEELAALPAKVAAAVKADQ